MRSRGDVLRRFAERGEKALGKIRKQPQVKQTLIARIETVHREVDARVDSLVDDAHDAAEKALVRGERARPAPSGEKVAQAAQRDTGQASSNIAKATKEASETVAELGADAAYEVAEAGAEVAHATRSTSRRAANRTAPRTAAKAATSRRPRQHGPALTEPRSSIQLRRTSRAAAAPRTPVPRGRWCGVRTSGRRSCGRRTEVGRCSTATPRTSSRCCDRDRSATSTPTILTGLWLLAIPVGGYAFVHACLNAPTPSPPPTSSQAGVARHHRRQPRRAHPCSRAAPGAAADLVLAGRARGRAGVHRRRQARPSAASRAAASAGEHAHWAVLGTLVAVPALDRPDLLA